ncbi:MAG: hypothetical protein ACOYH4_06405 [Saccharofermentanales bacterium]|jgi:hypothetical protein
MTDKIQDKIHDKIYKKINSLAGTETANIIIEFLNLQIKNIDSIKNMKTVSAEEVFGRRIAISHLENVIGRLQTKVSDKKIEDYL